MAKRKTLAELVAAHERAEARMIRAQNAWQATRERLRKAERLADKAWKGKAETAELVNLRAGARTTEDLDDKLGEIVK